MSGERRPPPPIPVTVLTGFLGAGKTTLLNAVLPHPALADTLVLVNEFGSIGLDHHLIEAADDDLVLLSSGCLCCSIRGDLIRLLEDLLRRRDNRRMPAFERLVIETTGLADPAPVLAAILAHPYLKLRYRIAGVITVVDALSGLATLEHHGEARRQAALADVLVISKLDREGAETGALAQRLEALNPAAPRVTAQAVATAPGTAFAPDLFNLALRSTEARRSLYAEALRPPHGPHGAADPDRHSARVAATLFESDGALPLAMLDSFLDGLATAFGAGLLRLKGLMKLAETPDRPVAVHLVQGIRQPLTVLDRWPDGEARTRLVLIADGIPSAALTAYCAAFLPARA